MKKFILLILASIFFLTTSVKSQELGTSFSYFFPKNGYFSIPVAPVSIRGVGFSFGNYIAINGGISLYRISGMQVISDSYQFEEPLAGPFFSVLIPAQLQLILPLGNAKFKVHGGGFLYTNMGMKMQKDALHTAIMESTGAVAVSSNSSLDESAGTGWQFGADFTYYIKKNLGINIKGRYYMGESDYKISGDYTAAYSDGTITQETLSVPDAKLDFTGLELGVGVVFKR